MDDPEKKVARKFVRACVNFDREWCVDLIMPCVVIPWSSAMWFLMLAYEGQIAVIMIVIHCAPFAP